MEILNSTMHIDHFRDILQMLHSTHLYIFEMLEFIAKQRLAPPKSETLSDSHHAFVSWIILIGPITCTC